MNCKSRLTQLWSVMNSCYEMPLVEPEKTMEENLLSGLDVWTLRLRLTVLTTFDSRESYQVARPPSCAQLIALLLPSNNWAEGRSRYRETASLPPVHPPYRPAGRHPAPSLAPPASRPSTPMSSWFSSIQSIPRGDHRSDSDRLYRYKAIEWRRMK